MTSTTRRYNRTLFTAPAPGDDTRSLIRELDAEDMELVLDARPDGSAQLAKLCADADMYYVHQPGLPRALASPDPSADRHAAEAAHLALRHRTCLLAPNDVRPDVAAAVAGVVGMRVLDLAASPSSVSLPGVRCGE